MPQEDGLEAFRATQHRWTLKCFGPELPLAGELHRWATGEGPGTQAVEEMRALCLCVPVTGNWVEMLHLLFKRLGEFKNGGGAFLSFVFRQHVYDYFLADPERIKL